jgi:hypothetical protein
MAALRKATEGSRATPPPPLVAATLTSELTALARRLAVGATADPAVRAKLAQIASHANGAIKAGDLSQAAELIDQLRDALSPASEAAPDTASVQIWNEAKDNVDGQLNELYALLRRAGLKAFDEIASEIDQVLVRFRVGLAAALIDYDSSSGPARNAAGKKALAIVQDYQSRIPSDKHVIAADTNPFGVSVTVRATLGAALERLSRELST